MKKLLFVLLLTLPFFCFGQSNDTNQFKNGKKNGLWIEKNKEGFSFHINYKDGEKHGKEKGFYPNGEVYYQMNYKNGELDEGFMIGYFKNGKIKYITHRDDNGELDGVQRWYSSTTGEIIRETVWEHGNFIRKNIP